MTTAGLRRQVADLAMSGALMQEAPVERWQAMTAEQARRAFGRQVMQLRQVRKRSASSVAGAVGVGATFMKRIERGESGVPFIRAIRLIRVLDPEPAV